jgi:uncharacterized membrane protein YhhN
MNAGNAAMVLNILIISAILILNYFYQRNHFTFKLKCVCSSAFALLGISNLGFAIGTNQANMQFYLLMATGLVFAMLGDIFIGKSFLVGAGLFALGHVCFVIAYFFLQAFSLCEVLLSALIFIASAVFLIFAPCLNYKSESFRWICVAYALIISLMLGKAVANLIIEPIGVNILIAMGSFLFFFSDLMLVLNWFVGKWKWTANACMGTYYPALCILAFSMYYKIT